MCFVSFFFPAISFAFFYLQQWIYRLHENSVESDQRWFLLKQADQDLHCFQKEDISGFDRARVQMKVDTMISHTWDVRCPKLYIFYWLLF